ncbi:MAG TPA: hypothetical protein VK390_16465 [Propionibacteriaceae bacterium]|jgi:hypothetical protein|nr:hypothetical protein [Propionibacteriaceae bacterium]
MISHKPTTTMTAKQIDRAALAMGLAYALTTVHHIYGGLVDAAPIRLRVPIIMAIPTVIAVGSLYRYRKTGSRAALITAGTVGSLAWVVLSGLLHGGYAHAYKDVLFLLNGPSRLYHPLNPSEHYPPDNLFFEITGVLETATALLVAFSMYRVIQDWLSNNSADGVGQAQDNASSDIGAPAVPDDAGEPRRPERSHTDSNTKLR